MLRDLRRFELFETGGIELAARNCRAVRVQGRTIRKTIDCVSATFCLRKGHSLLHCDRAFDPVEQRLGLRVVHSRTGGSEPPVADNRSGRRGVRWRTPDIRLGGDDQHEFSMNL